MMRCWFSILILSALVSGCESDPQGPGPSPDILSWTFDDDLEGWTVETTSVDWGKAQWASKGDGVIELDGVGNSDSGPNAWAWKSVDLPDDAKTLRFSSSAHDRGSGTGFLRVCLVDDQGTNHNIVALHVMETGDEGFEFETEDADISVYAGQTVTLRFELEDEDGGGNNQRYIGSVQIRR